MSHRLLFTGPLTSKSNTNIILFNGHDHWLLPSVPSNFGWISLKTSELKTFHRGNDLKEKNGPVEVIRNSCLRRTTSVSCTCEQLTRCGNNGVEFNLWPLRYHVILRAFSSPWWMRTHNPRVTQIFKLESSRLSCSYNEFTRNSEASRKSLSVLLLFLLIENKTTFTRRV